MTEDLDWYVYRLCGLIPATDVDDESYDTVSLLPGQRSFEIAWAHALAARAAPPTDWFSRHGAIMSTVDSLPEPLRNIAAQRCELLLKNPELRIIERADYKRRWGRVQSQDVDSKATVDWLAEAAERAFEAPEALKRRHVLTRIGGWSHVEAAISGYAVPFLAAHRFAESGLEKRAEWERVWDLQRAEDRGEKLPPFDPPPKYDQKDYRDGTFWRLRGKLDVTKERFISYPGCESDEDKEPVYGWAGWNHLQQAQALAALYQKRKTEETWGKERLTPMLAGLLELIPWVKQWHNDPSVEFGGLRLGDYFETFLDGECHALGLTREDLRAWRPAEKAKGKKTAAKKAKAEAAEAESDGNPAPKPRGRKKKTVTEVTETE